MSENEKWVTFDCYGTLLDWETGFRSILRPIAGDRTDELVALYRTTEIEVEAEDPAARYAHVLTESLTRAAATLGIPLGGTDRDVLVRQWDEIGYYPDTLAALDALHADGWRLAILTNCDDDLVAATQDRLRMPLDLIITAEQVHSYKPGLGHFLAFERQTGVARDRWVHAAVSWHHDMRPARELGLTRVWVDRERSGEDDSIVSAHIHDMAALPETLRALGTAAG